MNTHLDSILREFRRRLEEIYGPRLLRLVLFGSQARGDADPDSDIDVLIVLAGPLDDWAETQRTSKVTSKVSVKFDTDIARIFATPEDYAEKTLPFYEAIRREGVSV
ncbi:MAG: nucleotidyltransferase domain-containing protein [Proteobacteria bacterium]|nr:nucleotidyltransferase domain-containing protein [Pseudomonadota bacterium]